MNPIISLGLRFVVSLQICLAAFASFAQSQISSSGEGATVQRVLQYEFLLGNELGTKVGICVDDAMGKEWFLDEDLSQEIRPSALNNLRSASEKCAVTMSAQKGRLAAQLRTMTEHQLKLAMQLDPTVNASRNCLKTSRATEAIRACIATAMGKPPTENEWGFWKVLIQKFTL